MSTSAILYAAKSTEDKGGSITTQLEDCRDLAEERGWTVAAEYSDEGFSAYSGNRGPDLAKARAHAAKLAAESGEVVMLVAQAHDRFARGAGDRPGAPESLGEIWHAMRRLDVELHTVEDDEELRDEASVAAIGRRAHIDSQRKGRSVRKGMRRVRERGRHAGGAVFGYKPDPRTRSLDADERAASVGIVPNDDTAPILRRIFEMAAAGVPQAQIARTLNGEGVKPMRGANWSQGSISALLRRRTYVGDIPADDWQTRANRNVVEAWKPGLHEGIVSRELFEAAQDAVARRSRTPNRGGGRRPVAGHLLTRGLLRHVCGAAMTPRSGEPQKDGTVSGWYICEGRKAGTCEGLRVGMTAVDEAVLSHLAAVGIDADESVRLAQAATETTRATLQDDHDAAVAEVARADERLKAIRADYMDGAITAADWSTLRVDLEAARDDAQERADAAAATLATPPEDAVPVIVDALALVRGAVDAGDADQVRKIVGELFECFEVGRPATEAELQPEPLSVRAVERQAADTDALADVLREDYDMPEPEPIEPAAGLVIMPVPRRSALASVMDGDDRVYLVDAEGRDVFERIPLASSNVHGLIT